MLATLLDVQKSIETDALIPAFQPQVELRSGHLTGFEVLARWQHPRMGMILPVDFISLAEKHGLIRRLTFQIMRKAFRTVSTLPAPICLSVNISPIQLRDRSLPKQIKDAAEQENFPLSQLTVEITESALVDNIERAQGIAKELKQLGCRLAMDDCGTGYSSLLYLQALPFDEIKVDRSFVKEMTSHRGSRKIVGAVVGLGHALGITTVAEGVETDEQAEMLLTLGCNLGQGYLYGRPVGPDQLPEVLAAPPRPAAPQVSESSLPPLQLESFPAQHLAQLRAVYDGSPAGLCFLDCQMRYVSVNRFLAELNGVPASAHLGKLLCEMAPDEFAQTEQYIRLALTGSASGGIEVTKEPEGPDAPKRTFLESFEPTLDEAGETVGVSIAVVDITARKLAEEAVRISEDHYRSFVNLSPHAPWVADADGKLIEVGEQWSQMSGLSREESLGFGWLKAVHPQDIERRMAALAQSVETGSPTDVEYRLKSVDGSYRWVRSRAWPRHNASGEIVRWYGCLDDIDERRQANDRMIAMLRAQARCKFGASCRGPAQD